MSNVRILMTADFEKALKEHDKILRRTEKILETQKKQRQESDRMRESARKEREEKKRIADEQRRLNSEAERFRRIIDRSKTPQERFNSEMEKASDLRRRGIMDDKEFMQVQRSLTQVMERENDTIEKSSAAYQQKIAAQRRAKEIQESLLTPQERYERNLREIQSLERQGMITKEQLAGKASMLRRELNQTFQPRILRNFSSELIGTIGTIVGIQQGVQKVREELESVSQNQEDAGTTIKTYGQSVEIARANMADLNAQQFAAQEKFVRSLQFPDQGTALRGLAAAYSVAGGGIQTARRAQEATRVSAELLRNNPEALERFAPALVSIMNALDTDDAEDAAAFVRGVGMRARIERPLKQALAAVPVVGGAIRAQPEIEDSEALALQAGAVLARLGQEAEDPTGEATRTAGIQFVRKLDELFDVTVPEEITKLKNSISDFEEEARTTDKEQLAIDEAQDRLNRRRGVFDNMMRGMGVTSVEDMAPGARRTMMERRQREVRGLEIALREAIESAGISAEDQEALDLARQQLKALEAIPNQLDLRGRIETVAGSTDLRSLLFANEWAEQQFKGPIERMFDATTETHRLLMETIENFQFRGVDVLSQMQAVSETEVVSRAARAAQAAGQQTRLQQTEEGLIAELREISSAVLGKSTRVPVSGVRQVPMRIAQRFQSFMQRTFDAGSMVTTDDLGIEAAREVESMRTRMLELQPGLGTDVLGVDREKLAQRLEIVANALQSFETQLRDWVRVQRETGGTVEQAVLDVLTRIDQIQANVQGAAAQGAGP